MEESQEISRQFRDMHVKPLPPEGDSQTRYIPTDFFSHINSLSLAGTEPVQKRYVAQ